MIPQKVKGQQSIFVVKQAIMVEVQQLNLCTVEIHPCYLPRHKNLLLTFDLLGLSKTIIPFFHWALQLALFPGSCSAPRRLQCTPTLLFHMLQAGQESRDTTICSMTVASHKQENKLIAYVILIAYFKLGNEHSKFTQCQE